MEHYECRWKMTVFYFLCYPLLSTVYSAKRLALKRSKNPLRRLFDCVANWDRKRGFIHSKDNVEIIFYFYLNHFWIYLTLHDLLLFTNIFLHQCGDSVLQMDSLICHKNIAPFEKRRLLFQRKNMIFCSFPSIENLTIHIYNFLLPKNFIQEIPKRLSQLQN